MKILIIGLLLSFNLFAAENNVRPTICYTSADCIDSAGPTIESVLIRMCNGRDVGIPFKKYQVCKLIANKPFGYCELEETGFEIALKNDPTSCWNGQDLP